MNQPSIWQRGVQKFASSSRGATLFSKTMHHLDGWSYKLTNGNTTLTSIFTGLPVVTLTTIGAKSGLPRSLPLLCVRDENKPATFAVIASNWGGQKNPAWYYNLKANPEAIGVIGGQEQAYLAHEADGEEYERLWEQASATYPGFPNYKIRAGERRIPIMVLEPKSIGI